MKWILPGVYAIVYLNKSASGFDLIHQFDFYRPHIICPNLVGKRWYYLKRKLRNVNSLATRGILCEERPVVHCDRYNLSLDILDPGYREVVPYVPLIELMVAYYFLPQDIEILNSVRLVAGSELYKAGFNPKELHAGFFRVDFDSAGLHDYCIIGGANRLLQKIQQTISTDSDLQVIDNVYRTIDESWFSRLASYLGVILWSKMKYNPDLRMSLLDDWDDLDMDSSLTRARIENSFSILASTTMNAFARNPF